MFYWKAHLKAQFIIYLMLPASSDLCVKWPEESVPDGRIEYYIKVIL